MPEPVLPDFVPTPVNTCHPTTRGASPSVAAGRRCDWPLAALRRVHGTSQSGDVADDSKLSAAVFCAVGVPLDCATEDRPAVEPRVPGPSILLATRFLVGDGVDSSELTLAQLKRAVWFAKMLSSNANTRWLLGQADRCADLVDGVVGGGSWGIMREISRGGPLIEQAARLWCAAWVMPDVSPMTLVDVLDGRVAAAFTGSVDSFRDPLASPCSVFVISSDEADDAGEARLRLKHAHDAAANWLTENAHDLLCILVDADDNAPDSLPGILARELRLIQNEWMEASVDVARGGR